MAHSGYVSETVQPPGFFTHRAYRNKHLIGKKKGGGVCLMINETCCNHNIQELKYFCSPDLEFLTITCCNSLCVTVFLLFI